MECQLTAGRSSRRGLLDTRGKVSTTSMDNILSGEEVIKGIAC